jgi:hypothetical protein
MGWGTTWSNLSTDGKTLVLTETTPGTQSTFLVYDPRKMQFRTGVVLDGKFTFDALSPDGSRLYLIQQMSAADLSRYVVRAYDLRRRRLLPGRIADRTQKSWVMSGYRHPDDEPGCALQRRVVRARQDARRALAERTPVVRDRRLDLAAVPGARRLPVGVDEPRGTPARRVRRAAPAPAPTPSRRR